MRYKDILLWGHSLADFTEMFNLTEKDLQGKVLDFYGGPDSFNAEFTAKGGKVVSCDSIFKLSREDIEKRVETVFDEMLKIVKHNQDRFIWDKFKSPDELAEARHKNIELFLKDYEQGKADERYIACEYDHMPFKDGEFDLALCSHYLFANCPEQTIEFHISAITELCIVARELRIFPLLNSLGEIPDFVGPLLQELNEMEYGVEIKAVPYEFQKKGNAMLRIWPQTCDV